MYYFYAKYTLCALWHVWYMVVCAAAGDGDFFSNSFDVFYQ